MCWSHLQKQIGISVDIFWCKPITSMRTIIALIVALTCTVSAQQPTVTATSVADIGNITSSNFSTKVGNREVSYVTLSGVNAVYFGTRLDFPTGTTSVTLNSVNFSVTRKVGGGTTVIQLSGVNMALSQFNPETDASTPSILASPTSPSGNLVGTAMVNSTSLWITEHKVTLGGSFPKMSKPGDYYELSRLISGNATINGIVTPFTISTLSRVTAVINPVTGNPVIADGKISFPVTGVLPGDFGLLWGIEKSTDLLIWSRVTSPEATIVDNGNGVTISFIYDPGTPRKFFRIATGSFSPPPT